MKKSALLIMSYDDECLFIKRKNNLRAFPGYTSFPGGKVDKNESLVDAVIREANEELGVRPKSSDLTLIGEARTPDFNPIRFHAYYFFIKLKRRPTLKVCSKEIEKVFWSRPYEILNEFEKSEHLLIEPMLKICQYLEKELLNQKTKTLPRKIKDFSLKKRSEQCDFIEPIGGLYQIMPKSLTLPPADRTNSFLIDDLIVDPSPRDESELKFYISTLEYLYKKNKKKPSAIFITHHHFDHHKYSSYLSKYFEVPILISKDSFTRITNKVPDYFSDNEVCFIKEGSEVCLWKGQSVKALEVPGHDEGHLALYPENKKWCVVGDLFQGIGTVVVGGDEGDMIKYFESLKKVIEMNPFCVIPSHGIALGGTFILEKTLKHRTYREKQVLELHNDGLSLEDICAKIYFDLPSNLIKYAKANIRSHLVKLSKENKI